jgi:hypothetical protein
VILWRSSLFLVALAAILGGCSLREWDTRVVSPTAVSVILRIEYAGGSRDVFVPAGSEGFPIILAHPRPPAKVYALDPQTCLVLASDDMPNEPAAISIADGSGPGEITIDVYAKDVGGSTVIMPTDSRCVGR